MEKYGLIGEKLGHSYSKLIHEQLADYKKINEWNLPIDDSRLSYRKIEITFDIFIKSSNLTMNKLKSAIKDKLDIGDSVFDIAFDDENGNGKFLYVVRCESKEKQEFYFVISDDNTKVGYQMIKDGSYISPMEVIEING